MEYLEVSKEKNKDEAFGKEDVLSVSGDYGIVNQIEFQGRSFAGVSVAPYGVVETGDIVYTKSPLKSNPYGIIKTNKGKPGIVSTLYAVYKPLDNVYSEFVQIYFEQDARMNNYMHPLVNKGAKNDMKVSDENALKGEVCFPCRDEQIKISEYFAKLDNLLTLHQRKCDELKKVKKFMLQNLFPKNGEKYPAIRFEGFTDAWEQRKLGEMFERFIVPMRDKPKEFSGSIPWTRIEDIEGKYLNGSLSGQYVSEETVNNMNLKIIPKDSLIVSSSATFGVAAIVTRDLITNQTFIGLVPREKETLDYWYAFFYSDEARNYMRVESAGSTIFYIARESFEKMPIKVPIKDEMILIGEYFSNLDNLLTLHQRKLPSNKNQEFLYIKNIYLHRKD